MANGMRLVTVCAVVLSGAVGGAQMQSGMDVPGFAQTFDVVLGQREVPYSTTFVKSDVPGNVLWPGEQGSFTFQLVNNLDAPIAATGKVDVIRYGTKGRPGDIWTPDAFRIAEVGSAPIDVELEPKGFANLTVKPTIPSAFGGYGLVVDLGQHGRQFITSLVRTFAAEPGRVQFPKLGMDVTDPVVLQRLGCKSIRFAVGYKPTSDADFARWYAEQAAKLKQYWDANVSVIVEFGAGAPNHANQPLGQPRPHLTDAGVMMATKSDMAWLPSYDPDFREVCRRFAADFGWPKGPVVAMKLWNEPWEGLSISGWGADMPRYREIFTALCEGVEAARRDAGVEVLLGGCDSSSNTFDKLFGDGSGGFLKWLDFCSIHYQGMQPPSTVKQWVDRKSPRGRVRIWDTESWVANCDDRVAAVIATNMSTGHDRAVGVYGGNIRTAWHSTGKQILGGDAKPVRIDSSHTWSVAAAVAAAQHFIGERRFKELLFRNGLPWVMVFDGLPRDGRPDPDDGTVVVVGDIGDEFGAENLLFRTARGLAEVAHEDELRRQIAGLPAEAAQERRKLQAEIDAYETLRDARMAIRAQGSRFGLYDFYGNPVRPQDGKIIVPLDHRGFFLRADGSKGSFAALVEAMRSSRIEGIEPLASVCLDMLAPIERNPTLRLELTNVLNRPVAGELRLTLAGLQIDYPRALRFKPNETRLVPVKIEGGKPNPDNTYALSLTFDAGADGRAVHQEDMHCNVISRRTIQVDGVLDDWRGVLPQTVSTDEQAKPTLAEAAWFPFVKFEPGVGKGYANGYLAYDARFLYFAARIADDTPDEGTLRFETRDDEQFYYPEVAYRVDTNVSLLKQEASRAVAPDDEAALQMPEGAGRSGAYWENDPLANAFAVDLRIDPDRRVRVALYLLPWDSHPNGVVIQAIDLDTNVRLDEQRLDNLWSGTFAVYELSGNVRLRLQTNGWWYTVKLGGLFLDPAGGAAQGAGAKVVSFDYDTKGNWQGKYGADGYHVIGSDAKYPPYVRLAVPEVMEREELRWPDGVRRYSYRKDPILPAGNAPNFDNVQLAFNVLPPAQKEWYPYPPGTMPGYIGYQDTDYEYALNKVAERYGGGVEIWRLKAPGMPHKHFYPRQAASPFDGPVRDGKLAIEHQANTRVVEAALPWTEIPPVKQALDAGRTIKFSFRVNDNAGAGCLELSKNRSVAKRNGSFHVDWAEHWANELEFAFER